MPTPVFATGFEHGVVITGATPIPNDRIWHTVVTTGGTPAINTTEARSGARCLEIPATSGAASYVGRNVAGSPTAGVKSFFVKFKGSLPTADCKLFTFVTAAGAWCDVRYQTATTDIRGRVGSTNGSSGVTVVADTWYRIDCLADVGGTTRTMDVQVNGTACGQASEAATASTISSFRIGKNTDTTTANANLLFDDLVLSVTSGDYPLGDHEVLVMRPASDGTHSFTAGDFGYDDAGANVGVSDTDVWTRLDDTTIETIGTTDSIRQKVIRTTGYIEIGFDASPQPGVDAWGIQVHGAYDGSTTGAHDCELKINDGGTLADLYIDADFSNTSVTFNTQHRATAPSGGAWTQAKLDALKLRWGYSDDVTGNPIIHGLMIEAVFPVAGAAAFELDAAPGSYAVTGVVAGLVANFVLAAEVAAYALTGAAATVGVEQNAAPGSYAITGAVAGLVANVVENAAPGAYVITGQAATFALEFPATAGAYNQTGFVADLEFTGGGPTEFLLDAAPGAYSLTGAPAGLVVAYLFAADPGSYALNGAVAGLVAGYVVEAVPGVYLLTGTAAEFDFLAGGAFELDAAPGVYVVTGYADGAVIVEPVTGRATYEVVQGGVRRVLVARSGGKRREV